MYIMLSINNKFFNVPPKDFLKLVNKHNKSNIIKGFECIANNQYDKDYIKEIVKNSNGEYICNLHSPNYKEIEKDYEYLDFANDIYNIQKRRVNIVYHPEYEKDYVESIRLTIEKLEKIFNYIKEKNYENSVEISIENLNLLNGKMRLKKENFVDIFEKYKDLKFTYDIGHEIVDGIVNYDLENIFVNRLNNFHIHTFNKENKNDHYPIENFDENTNIKILLEKYDKAKTVVLEYALDYINGNNFEEKVKNYINSANILINAIKEKK